MSGNVDFRTKVTGLSKGITLLTLVASSAACSSGSTGDRSTTSGGATTPTSSSTGTTGTTGTPAKTGTIFSQTGSGYANTAEFTVPSGGWDLDWSYSCPPNASTGAFRFVAVVYSGTSRSPNDIAITQSAPGGRGTQHYADAGTFSLHIGSLIACAWSVSITVPG